MNQKASRYCEQCGKAKRACICHTITTIPCDIPLIILQHPSEVHQPIGTARILSLSLTNSRLFVGEDFSNNDALNTLLDPRSGVDYVVLYPSDDAISLSSENTEIITGEDGYKRGLILLDGTWRKAYKMYQLSKNLHALPAVKLDEIEQGNYRIRKSPKESGLSTVEAGFYALSAMTGEQTRFHPLMAAFDSMIEFQISQMPPGVYEQHYGCKNDNENE
ncbi:tRNA-uridine aminocarboxypropyltransferase [Enterovibrio norvegicus]|uniref:tRNA-uridine aminocarboxypropyltransferase n=1 Tax=Enterovibrio norvegicus TaxID=188144 RepID=UPI000C859DDD|nr:tRNA-uridine aminocarboxypropyltransferase [Enterovibrio norvegicus]PML80864.1 DTW domain-containing protein [Enterovibrio norvegicus]